MGESLQTVEYSRVSRSLNGHASSPDLQLVAFRLQPRKAHPSRNHLYGIPRPFNQFDQDRVLALGLPHGEGQAGAFLDSADPRFHKAPEFYVLRLGEDDPGLRGQDELTPSRLHLLGEGDEGVSGRIHFRLPAGSEEECAKKENPPGCPESGPPLGEVNLTVRGAVSAYDEFLPAFWMVCLRGHRSGN